MKVLVTGGAGFIGSHTVDALLKSGHEVVVVDDLSTGHIENVNKDAKVYELDIREAGLAKVISKEKPERVYHLAAQVKVVKSIKQPVFDLEVNLGATINLVEACADCSVEKIIYSSTGGAVYGEPDVSDLPVAEDYPLKPLSYYGVHKHTVEHYLHMANVNHGIDYTVLRYPNVYGPRQDPHGEAGVVAIFSIKIIDGRQPTIFGDGSKTRDYVYVDDVVRANLAVLESGSGEIYNLGWGVGVRDDEVFDAVRDALDSDIKPIMSAKRKGEVEHISLNAEKIASALGWRPSVTFKEGVRRSVEFYKNRPEWIASF